MNDYKKWALFSGIFLILLVPLWFVLQTNDDPPVQAGDGQPLNNQSRLESQVSERTMKLILADDLAKTTKLFMDQLHFQLERWASYDLSQEELRKRFEEEVKEHPHFSAFALVQEDKVIMQTRQMDLEQLEQLRQNSLDGEHQGEQAGAKNDMAGREQVSPIKKSTDPYVRDGKSYMLIGIELGNQWVVGEIDLSFVKGYVGAIAEVADASGNMFISADQQRVKWSAEDVQDSRLVTQKVEELDWTIILQEEEDTEEEEEVHYIEKEALVKFKEGSNIQDWLANQPMIEVQKESVPYYTLRHDHLSTKELLSFLEAEQAVQYAEPNYIYHKQAEAMRVEDLDSDPVEPNDEFYRPYQWNLSQIKAENAWEITAGTEEVIIAILDTGIDPNHLDLEEKLTDGYNAFDRSSNYADDHGHGTHVAGIAGAITNNVTGIAGVTWYNPIMPVKVLDGEGEGGIFEIAEGIRWATDQGAGVINLSLGDVEHSMMLYEAIRYAYEQDVVLIAAAGNDNVGQPMYPAGYPEVLAVSAVDENQEKAAFSNYGDHMDVAAPGEHIPSTFPDNQYVFMSGTSMASPHVAGVAGLIRSVHTRLSNEEVYDILRKTSEDLGPKGHDPYYGYGEVNVANAMQFVLNQEKSSLHMDGDTVLMEREWWVPLQRILDWFR